MLFMKSSQNSHGGCFVAATRASIFRIVTAIAFVKDASRFVLNAHFVVEIENIHQKSNTITGSVF